MECEDGYYLDSPDGEEFYCTSECEIAG